MGTPKFSVLAESGYPKDDIFTIEMEKMWNECVPPDRQAKVAEFARFINGEDTPGLFAAESAADATNSSAASVVVKPTTTRGRGFTRPIRAVLRLFGSVD